MGNAATVSPALPSPAVSLLRLVHPFPSLVVTTLTLALVPLADRDASWTMYAQLGIGMLLFQFCIGLVNDIVDLEDDAVAKPWKALPRGIVGRPAAIRAAAALAGAGAIATAALPLGAWLIGLAGLFCGLAYDVSLKRTPLSWLPWSVAFPLVPSWVYRASDTWDALLWWAFPLGAGLGLALHLANQAPDITSDRAAGIEGAAQLMGGRRARALALVLFGVVASIVLAVLLVEGERGRAILAAADAGFVALLAPRATRFFGRDGLFGLLAAGSAILAAVFISSA